MRRIYLGLIVILSLFMISCGSRYEDLEKISKSLELKGGYNVMDLEDDMFKFIYGVYSASSEQDIKNRLEGIKKYLTEDEYKELVDISKYVGGDGKVVSVDSLYSRGENNSDGMGRLYVKLKVSDGKYTQDKLIEFVLNKEDKIFKHYIWNGVTK
ncbi:MAG: hypothetical protein QXD03_05505 [Candidatus Anstonellales archaeon]